MFKKATVNPGFAWQEVVMGSGFIKYQY